MDREFSRFEATDDNTIKKKERKCDILKGLLLPFSDFISVDSD